MSRRTEQERAEHLRLMENSLIEGVRPTEVVRIAVDKFKVSDTQAWKDLKEIRKNWTKYGAELRDPKRIDEHLARAINIRQELYRLAKAGNDLKTALAVEQDLAKLLRLYDDTVTVRHAGADGGALKIVCLETVCDAPPTSLPPPSPPDEPPALNIQIPEEAAHARAE